MLKLNKKVVALILSVLLFLPTAASAGKKIGEITRLKGRVTIYRDGAKIGISAKNGMALEQNDKIKTRAKAYLRFKLNDGSSMTLGQKAELTLDRFTYNPEKKERVAFFNIALGKLRIFANRMLKYRDNRFQVKTPTAVAGVRGTVFMVWVESPTATRIACLDSVVDVANVMEPDEYVVLTKNILTSVNKGKTPSKPVLMTEKVYKDFQKGFDGDIKPVDEETGYKSKKDSEKRDGREAPDPTEMEDVPPELINIQDESPETDIEGSHPLTPEDVDTGLEPEPVPGVVPLPAPPAVPQQ